jgi:hypothetical protein
MEEIKVGDKVKYKVGRGFARGEVCNIDGEIAEVRTANGYTVRRLIKALEKVG